VYDIVNCGVRQRFVVRGAEAPFIVHNCAQAFAAAILRNAVRQVPNVVAHVHDEIIQEVAYDESSEAVKDLAEIMQTTPSWAEGLPLEAEPVVMRRYGK